MSAVSALQKSDDGVPLIIRGTGAQRTLGQASGLIKSLTKAEFDSLIADERNRISANSIGAYQAGERLGSIIGEVGTRSFFLGTGGSDAANAAASHGRVVSMPNGRAITLAADSNTVTAGTGAPTSGNGTTTNDGNYVFDAAANLLYGPKATNWPAGVAHFPGGSGSTVAKLSPAMASVGMLIYGHSYTTTPGQQCTAGLEFFNLLKNSARIPAFSTYGVASSRLIDVFYDLCGTNSTPWPAGRKGFALLDCIINDAYNPPSNAANVQGSALSATQLQNYADTLTACFAMMSSSSRVDTSTGAVTGTWTTSASVNYSGGSLQRTTVQGATNTVAVTVPASGVVYLLCWGTPGTLGDFTVTEGGTTYATVSGSSLSFAAVWSRRAGASQTGFPFVVKITATPGAHSFVITKTDATTNTVFVDTFLLQDANPVAIGFVRDPTLVAGNNAFNSPSANLAITLANQAALEAKIATVVAAWPNVTFVDPQLQQATDLSVADTLHPNDRGMLKYANAVNAWLGTLDLNGQYTTL